MMALGLIGLLKDKRFVPVFLTQFFAAFNDNAFKLAMLTLISYDLSNSQIQSEYYQAIAGGLFILPFFILSATSGQIVDKYNKAMLTRWVKVFELVLMIIGGFALYKGSIFLMLLILTGLGIHSSFFGPIKYAILPDLLPEEDILGATGLVQASTFIAILLGTTLGALAIGVHHTIPYAAILMTLFAALAGLFASLFIPGVPSALKDLQVDFNILRATLVILRQANSDKGVLFAILSISWFWLLGTVVLTKLPDYTHFVLGADTTVFALFLSLFSIGIALGSLLVTQISKEKNSLSIVPLAMLGFSLFTCDLYWASPDTAIKEPLSGFVGFFKYFMHWRIVFDFFMLSLCAGLFVVPLYTFLQIASPAENRARTIAANNIYNSLFMVLGTLMVMLLLRMHRAIPEVFLILGMLNALAAFCMWEAI